MPAQNTTPLAHGRDTCRALERFEFPQHAQAYGQYHPGRQQRDRACSATLKPFETRNTSPDAFQDPPHPRALFRPYASWAPRFRKSKGKAHSYSVFEENVAETGRNDAAYATLLQCPHRHFARAAAAKIATGNQYTGLGMRCTVQYKPRIGLSLLRIAPGFERPWAKLAAAQLGNAFDPMFMSVSILASRQWSGVPSQTVIGFMRAAPELRCSRWPATHWPPQSPGWQMLQRTGPTAPQSAVRRGDETLAGRHLSPLAQTQW